VYILLVIISLEVNYAEYSGALARVPEGTEFDSRKKTEAARPELNGREGKM
jgi:hypothetical protein